MDSSGSVQKLDATMGEGLPFAYFTVPMASDTNKAPIQLVTTPKLTNNLSNLNVPANVTVRAYNSSGQQVTSGTGPFELEVSYSVHDALDNIVQTCSTTMGSDMITVANGSQLAVGMGVWGPGINAGTHDHRVQSPEPQPGHGQPRCHGELRARSA